jgi:BTB/POZ domain
MFLAMASPVFEAMFYGGLAETTREIKILDVQPDAFSALLDYIYTDQVQLNSFELVCDICYAAKKYMLPDLGNDVTYKALELV